MTAKEFEEKFQAARNEAFRAGMVGESVLVGFVSGRRYLIDLSIRFDGKQIVIEQREPEILRNANAKRSLSETPANDCQPDLWQ